MSFLLEALRKSENQKNAGVVPTIHSTADLVSRPRKSFSPKILLLIILPALVVAMWFTWQWFDRPPLPAVAPPTVGQEANVPSETPSVVEQNESLPQIPASPVKPLPTIP